MSSIYLGRQWMGTLHTISRKTCDFTIILSFSWPITLLFGLGEVKTWRLISAAVLLLVSMILTYVRRTYWDGRL